AQNCCRATASMKPHFASSGSRRYWRRLLQCVSLSSCRSIRQRYASPLQDLRRYGALLHYTLIAIPANEARWRPMFKHAPAVRVVEENHPQRCVESSGELMTGHLSGSEWIANLIEQGVAFAAHNLEVGAVVDRCHD